MGTTGLSASARHPTGGHPTNDRRARLLGRYWEAGTRSRVHPQEVHGPAVEMSGAQVMHAEGMDTVLATLPPELLHVSFSERMIPGRQPDLRLTAGSNCQRYAYAVLRHFGLSVPDLRSSDLWADEELLTTVSEPERLDLVLFAAGPDPRGAHVGVYLGGTAVLHLCKEIGVPVVWDFTDFAERERYGSLIGFKRVRTQ